jgi:hypothetical protein
VKKVHILGVLFILQVTLATGAAAQNGVVTTTVTVQAPSDSIVSDPCTGENVTYNGSVQVVSDVWVDANGATHLRSRVPQINVSGVGNSTNNDYQVLAGGGTVELISADNKPFDETLVFRFALNGAGPVPNERMFTLFHLTVNADGTVTADVDPVQFGFKCNGK